MQHFLSENNLPNSVECILIAVVDNEEQNAKIIHTNPLIKDCYQKSMSQLKKAGDWACSILSENQTLLFYCFGKGDHLDTNALNTQLNKLANLVKSKPWKSIFLSLPSLINNNIEKKLISSILSFESSYYQFLNYKEHPKPYALETIYHDSSASAETLAYAKTLAEGISFCQNLANMPANDCNPIYLEKIAKELSREFKQLECHVLDQHDMEHLGLNTLLAVGQGSHNPPRLIELHLKQGPKKQKPLVIVGKGITFDSGGISLKPPEGMAEMKYDMAGAASVMGIMRTIAKLKLPINIIGVMACAENMPGGKATRPGDVIKSYAGKTIEITNTDAEGRLVLADAISYVQKYEPEAIVDMATLTGAVIVALGHVYTGLMSSCDKLADSLLQSGKNTEDKIWRLPLDADYEEALESPIADMCNSPGTRVAGSIVGAEFLKVFAEKTPWAHLDIAGSAWVSGKNNHATGRPVALLVDWIKNYNYES